MPSSRGSSQHRDCTHVSCVSCIGMRVLYPSRHLGSYVSFASRRGGEEGEGKAGMPMCMTVVGHWSPESGRCSCVPDASSPNCIMLPGMFVLKNVYQDKLQVGEECWLLKGLSSRIILILGSKHSLSSQTGLLTG